MDFIYDEIGELTKPSACAEERREAARLYLAQPVRRMHKLELEPRETKLNCLYAGLLCAASRLTRHAFDKRDRQDGKKFFMNTGVLIGGVMYYANQSLDSALGIIPVESHVDDVRDAINCGLLVTDVLVKTAGADWEDYLRITIPGNAAMRAKGPVHYEKIDVEAVASINKLHNHIMAQL